MEKPVPDPSLPLSFWEWIIGIAFAAIGALLAASHRALGERLDTGDKDRLAIWKQISENADLCRKQERDVMAMIAENRQRNADWQEKTSAAIARIEAVLASRNRGHAD